MISPTLKKIVEEELSGADIATKIQLVSSGRNDETISQRPIRLPVKETWRKTFSRTKEEIERYNVFQQKLANRGNSYHYEYGGNNVFELAIVPYKGSIPNGYVEIPHEIFSRYPAGKQEQIIFGEDGIVFREVSDIRPTYGIMVDNKTVLGELSGGSRHLIARPYEAILRSSIKAILSEPNDFLYNQYSSKYDCNDHIFSVVTFVPRSHLTLDDWWQENHRDFEKSYLPKMSDWNDVPLIYATILRPELERQGYVCSQEKDIRV